MSRSDDDPTRIRYKVREAVAVFHDPDRLESAIEALELAGFDRAQINVLTSRETAERKLGRPIRDLHELEDEPEIPHGNPVDRHERAEAKAALTAGLAGLGSLVAIGTVVASGGSLALLLAAAALAGGLGGGIGATLARFLEERHARAVQDAIAGGEVLLGVNLRDPEQQVRAVAFSREQGREGVDVHGIEHGCGAEEGPVGRSQPPPFLFRT